MAELTLGPDIDDTSIQSAEKNILWNGLGSRIKVHRSSARAALLTPISENAEHEYAVPMLHWSRERLILAAFPYRFDFVMCNPPFYSSKQDMVNSAEAKEFDPHSVSALECSVETEPLDR